MAADMPTNDADDRRLIRSVEGNAARYQAITPDIVAFPYGVGTTITYDMWQAAMMAPYRPDSVIMRLNEITAGGFSRLVSVFGDEYLNSRTARDFDRVISGLANHTVASTLGGTVELDRFGCPNIAAYMAGCRERVSVSVDELGSIDIETFVAPWHGRGPMTGEWEEVFGTDNARLTYEVDGEEWAILPYGLLWSWDMYKVIANLCADGYEDSIRTAIKRRRTDAKREAAAQGAIVSLGGHLTAYSSKEFWQAFMPGRIMQLPYAVKDGTFDGDGRLNELALGDQSLKSLTTLQENFLHAMATLVEEKILADDYDEQTTTISFHAGILDREMGIDPRDAGKRRDAGDTRTMAQRRFDKLNGEILPPFEPLVGCMPNGSKYRVLAFSGYDAETETITLVAPYIWQVARAAYKAAGGKPQVHHYLHADAGSRRSDAAFELANRIIYGVVTRGSTPDPSSKRRKSATSKTTTKKLADGSTVTDTTHYETKADRQLARERTRTELIQAIEAANTRAARERAEKRLAAFNEKARQEDYEFAHPIVTYKPRFQTIIDDCPQVKENLRRIMTDTAIKHPRQSYNDYLRKTFEAAYAIIMEQSDLPKKYRDLRLPTVKRKRGGKTVDAYDVPSMSTLDHVMVITHRGKIPERR